MRKIIHGDCLKELPKIPNRSIDMILCDPPYGTTACKWDSIIPLEPMWEQLKRVIKSNGAIVITSRNPFTSVLNISGKKLFRYELIWEKEQATNFMFVKKQFGSIHENISVFYLHQPTYNPQMVKTDKPIRSYGGNKSRTQKNQTFKGDSTIRFVKYPCSVLRFNRDKKSVHPTQKPVALMEYLIKTYTNEGETVLDFATGSGTTGVACINTNRNYILIEKEAKYIEIIKQRLEQK